MSSDVIHWRSEETRQCETWRFYNAIDSGLQVGVFTRNQVGADPCEAETPMKQDEELVRASHNWKRAWRWEIVNQPSVPC